jgi:DNA-binding GntR family transcriptional regulator
MRLVGDEERSPATIISQHGPIAGAVADRDPDRATTLVEEHLDRHGAVLAQALAERRGAPA